jgi:hypothetical protein
MGTPTSDNEGYENVTHPGSGIASQGYFPVPRKQARARFEDVMQLHRAQFLALVVTHNIINKNLILADDDTTR